MRDCYHELLPVEKFLAKISVLGIFIVKVLKFILQDSMFPRLKVRK